jgi:hypothetical protein
MDEEEAFCTSFYNASSVRKGWQARAGRQTDRRIEGWTLAIMYVYEGDAGLLRNKGLQKKLWEELPKRINHEDLSYSFLVKQNVCPSDTLLYLELRKVFFPAFGTMSSSAVNFLSVVLFVNS